MFENWQILTLKNFTIFKRNAKYSQFFMLTPIVIILMLCIFQYTYDCQMYKNTQVNTEITHKLKVKKCPSPKECVSIGYSIIGHQEDWIDDVMKMVARDNEMEFGKDVKLITQGTAKDFSNYISSNRNMTQIAVIFCTDKWDVNIGHNITFNIPCKFDE